MASRNRTRKPPVLADHKRVGKKLLPPFSHLLPSLHEISWRRQQMPEVLWISLVHGRFGDERAVELLTTLTRTARKVAPNATSAIFGTATAYLQLSDAQAAQLRAELEKGPVLHEVQQALRPLIALYPECPMRFIFEEGEQKSEEADLELLSRSTALLLDRGTREATMAQATLTWFGFDSGKLQVASGLTLAQFPRIEEYPDTDFSHRLAASIRAGLVMFFIEPHYPTAATWPVYFWKRGLEISPCTFK